MQTRGNVYTHGVWGTNLIFPTIWLPLQNPRGKFSKFQCGELSFIVFIGTVPLCHSQSGAKMRVKRLSANIVT